jgi:hypothetical protein
LVADAAYQQMGFRCFLRLNRDTDAVFCLNQIVAGFVEAVQRKQSDSLAVIFLFSGAVHEHYS